MFIGIGEAAQVIGVAVSTLRRWENEGKFLPDFRTLGNHRRYSLARIQTEILNIKPKIPSSTVNKTIAYARVSSFDQKDDLIRQEERLIQYCKSKEWETQLISDLGSGLNFNKRGLNQLIKAICTRQCSRLVLTHQDRLLRFGSPLIFKLCEFFDVEVVVLEQQLKANFEQELARDVIEIMTVFTAKMHGKRSHGNRKAA